MKQNGTTWNSPLNGDHTRKTEKLEVHPATNGYAGKEVIELDGIGQLTIDEIGDEHISTSYDTPMRSDAFELNDSEKMEIIEGHFREIMLTLGLDLSDDSLKGTPKRVSKMYIQEIFSGLNPANMPKIALFDNKYRYNEMLIEKNITFYSNCEHHFVPIIGKAHVGYVSNGKVIGLSKINRIVQFFAKRPQVQERLTVQIGNYLKEVLGSEDVAIVIDAVHMCVSSRGIQDQSSSTVTSYFGGIFKSDAKRQEFFRQVEMK